MGRRRSGPSTPSVLHPELLRSLFERAPDGITLTDRDGRYVEVNARFCEIVGRTREELITRSLADLVVPDELERLAAARAERSGAEIDQHEWRLQHGHGGEIHLEIRTCRLSTEHWLGFVRDATARRRAEDERQRIAQEGEAERRWLRTVLDAVPLAMLVFEPRGRLSFNHHAEQLLGMTLSPHGGSAQYRSRIFFRDGSPMSAEQLISTRVLRDGETILGAEGIIEHPDGSRTAVLGGAAPIRDADGTIIGGIGVFQDVSEQLQTQEAIRANERLLDGIFELLPVGVWIADRTGRIIRTNPAGLRIWAGARYVGVSEYGEYRAWWADTGKPLAADDWALARAIRKGEASIGEVLRIQCFDGSFKTIVNSALPLYDEQGQFAGAVVVNEDVSLREIAEALRRAIRSRDEVLRIVSHDLRGPLQSIVLAAELIRMQTETGVSAEMLRTSADRILRVSHNMARLVDDLLDISAITEGRLRVQPATVDPQPLLHEVVDTHQALAEAQGITLTVTPGGTTSPLTADRGRLLQALSNLVGNALKFVPAGGSVSLRADDVGDEVRVSVADSGPGIPAEHVPRVFDPFWQESPTDRRGRGLGLAIAKGIVEAHGGRIWIESELGRGTTVWFTVPKASRPAT